MCTVPKDVATCPECSGGLIAETDEWEDETGLPISLHIFCEHDLSTQLKHQGLFPDWNPVWTTVYKWAKGVHA